MGSQSDIGPVDVADPGNVALITSTYVNALGIARSLREIGWKGRIVCVKPVVDELKRSITERFSGLCETLSLEPDEMSDIPSWSRSAFVGAACCVVFLTDERFHSQFVDLAPVASGPRLLVHLGTERHLETVFDRRLFYDFISERGLAAVPLTLPSSADPGRELGESFHVRAWRSWRGLNKVPRGGSVRDKSDLDRIRGMFESADVSEEEWGYQELLGNSPEDNLSVSGWHDSEFALYYGSRPRVRSPLDKGDAVVIETCSIPAEIVESTRRILDALEYHGPFELEFLRDAKSGQLKVIELNARFWLQHRLVARLSKNALVRRYLGQSMTTGPEGPARTPRRKFWIGMVEVVARFEAGQWGVLKYMRPGAVYAPPCFRSLRASMRRILGRAVHRALRRVGVGGAKQGVGKSCQ